MISANIQRRHLTTEQRAMAAARIATLAHGGDRRGENFKTAAAVLNQSAAADKFDVSADSIQRARKVIEGGSKALQQAVEDGEVSLTKAAAVARLASS
ncbi:MAG: hypothetical protein IPI06_14600 [Gammaproteobacteria bacterium]|nr:hypothetical protein [Gammaproteobacteria bacterium]